MKKNPGRPDRFPLLLALGVMAALAVLAMAAQRSARLLEEQRTEERRLEQAVAAKEERIDELRQRIRRLRDDPETLERLAREEMGLVRPGEIVVVFPEEREQGGQLELEPEPAGEEAREELELDRGGGIELGPGS